MTRVQTLTAIAGASFGVAGCGAAHVTATPPPQSVTATGGPTLTGSDISITAFRGHPVVLVFWGSWCGPCRDEQPDLNSLDAKWSPRGVQFLGVDLRDNTKDALAFQRQFDVPYPSIADTQATLAVDYRIPSAPALVFLTARGEVADVTLGALGTMSVADFNTEITTLLGASGASA
ncbi:MAG TPA: TlpA disulfide reductase family protein [Candidatus Saccharimonadales bacterium]|nr:TlpA disulfide reductase family protein [Candidatus Saccharimonadales bacterium]